MVGPILLGKCSDKNWKVVMKALYVIQEVLNAPNTDAFKAYFKENTEEIQMLGSYSDRYGVEHQYGTCGRNSAPG